jgi:hypothetical protein
MAQQEMLQDSVIAIHQEQGEHFKAYEAAIVAILNTNYACCNDLLKKMDDTNSRWDRHYKQLTTRNSLGGNKSPISRITSLGK